MKKKIIVLLCILCFLISGCNNMTAKEAVRDYLEMYITLDDRIINQLDEYVSKENMSDKQKELYKEIMKKEYTTMTYEIINEKYDDDIAYITTKIRVVNLYDVQKKAMDYINENLAMFDTDEKKIDYKLEE